MVPCCDATLSAMKHKCYPDWSRMRARLSSRPSAARTSNTPGDTLRPVKAARSGWATLPSLRSFSSAKARTTASSSVICQSLTDSNFCSRSASRSRASVVRTPLAFSSGRGGVGQTERPRPRPVPPGFWLVPSVPASPIAAWFSDWHQVFRAMHCHWADMAMSG